MPKLLSLNSYHYRRGGSDVVYIEHDAMFQGAGWETAVMSMHHPRNESSPWSRYFVDELEFGHSYSPLQKLVMATKVIYSWEAKRKLNALLDEFSADVAHMHCIYHHISPAVLPVLKSRGVATVMTAHDLKLACPAYKMLNATGVCERCKDGNLSNVLKYRCIQGSAAASALVMVESIIHQRLGLYRRHLDCVVAPSKFYQNKLIAWGWDSQQVVYIPNFVDSHTHEPQFQPGNYFLYFGRLAVEKGLETLVRSAILSGVSLRLVGTGPMEAQLRAMAADAPNIEFLGYCSAGPLWEQVRGARAIVLPAEWYENAPMSILEAFANGKPVLGSNIGGIPELIDPGATGWLFPPGDVQALAEQMLEIVAMPDSRLSSMGQAARTIVEHQFSRQRYLDSMLSLYARLSSAA